VRPDDGDETQSPLSIPGRGADSTRAAERAGSAGGAAAGRGDGVGWGGHASAARAEAQAVSRLRWACAGPASCRGARVSFDSGGLCRCYIVCDVCRVGVRGSCWDGHCPEAPLVTPECGCTCTCSEQRTSQRAGCCAGCAAAHTAAAAPQRATGARAHTPHTLFWLALRHGHFTGFCLVPAQNADFPLHMTCPPKLPTHLNVCQH